MNKFKVGDKVNIIGRLIHKKQILGGIWEIVKLPKQIDYDRCCLCYQKGFDGHNACGEYLTNEYYYIKEENLKLYKEDYPEIRITTDGKTTTAQKILNGEVVKEASVTLYYKDTFDFITGCEEVLKKLNTVPHLESEWRGRISNWGNIGEVTIQTAVFGEKLYVGDIVELYDTNKNTIVKECIICKTKRYPNGFIKGLASHEFENGISENFQIRKIRSYKELKNSDIIDGLEVVK